MNYPRKSVRRIGSAARHPAHSLPAAFASWLAKNPEAAQGLELFSVSGFTYARPDVPSAGAMLIYPWQHFVGVPYDEPFVSERGEYLFKFRRVDLSGDGKATALIAESPEDGNCYVLDVA